nr:AmmeMemoRadiSam system protein A [Desulfobacula sp.]
MAKNISEEGGRFLLALARTSILQEFDKHEGGLLSTIPDPSQEFLRQYRGVFVSLHQKGNLKGCIGIIEPEKPLYEGVIDNAKHAAFHDSRFRPLSLEEFKDVKIEVSILTCPETIEYKDGKDLAAKIRPDIDGVIIRKNSRSATFLPQVWKQVKDPDRFLQQLCLKAGLLPDEWERGGLIVSTYQVQAFEEE